jgi:hypothetical protein
MKRSNLKRTLKSKKKSSKKSKSVPKRKVNKKNTKVKKRSVVKNNKTNKQKGGSLVGKNYDEGCNQLTKKTCGKNNDCMWLGTNNCVIRDKRCPICLQNIFSLTKEKGKTVSKQVLDLVAPNNCNHVFCIDCKQRLSESEEPKKCPMCRAPYYYFNNVSIDKNNVLVRSNDNDSLKLLLPSTPRLGVSLTEADIRRTFPTISNDEIRHYITSDSDANELYVSVILANILLLFKNYEIPWNDNNRFKNLIETSFSLNDDQSRSLLWRGDGVNEIVYDMVYDVQEEPLWFSEASKYKPTSFDDSNEHAFNMMMRYINEYKRVSTFGS